MSATNRPPMPNVRSRRGPPCRHPRHSDPPRRRFTRSGAINRRKEQNASNHKGTKIRSILCSFAPWPFGTFSHWEEHPLSRIALLMFICSSRSPFRRFPFPPLCPFLHWKNVGRGPSPNGGCLKRREGGNALSPRSIHIILCFIRERRPPMRAPTLSLDVEWTMIDLS